MFNFLLNDFLPQTKDDELRQLAVSSIISIASTKDHFKLLKEWLENKKPFYYSDNKKVKVDAGISIEEKHSILKLVSTFTELNDKEFAKFADSELEEDKDNQDLVER
jgi:hypothetical protein